MEKKCDTTLVPKDWSCLFLITLHIYTTIPQKRTTPYPTTLALPDHTPGQLTRSMEPLLVETPCRSLAPTNVSATSTTTCIFWDSRFISAVQLTIAINTRNPTLLKLILSGSLSYSQGGSQSNHSPLGYPILSSLPQNRTL